MTDLCLHLASGSEDSLILVWHIRKIRVKVVPPKGHVETVQTIRFSPSGRNTVSGSLDETIRIWRISTGEKLLEFICEGSLILQ